MNRAIDISEILILPKHKLDSARMTDNIAWSDLHAVSSSENVRQAGEKFSNTEKSPILSEFVGSGPYIFENWERGQSVQLRKSSNYWAQNIPMLEAYPDRLTYIKIGDEARVVV